MEQNYKINLELFEGPLDLLLHLIRKNDLNIYDIPISLILNEYLLTLDMMKEFNIDIAGEFILMASELAHIKSCLLVEREDEEEGEEPDPRANLVARLLEYEKYKRAASYLNSRPVLFRDVFKRGASDRNELERGGDETALLEVEPFVLLSAFNEILKKAPRDSVHDIEAERISVTEKIYQILTRLHNTESLLFENLFDSVKNRGDVVITFLALLEMARLRMVQIFQTGRFEPILVKKSLVDEVDLTKEELKV